MTNQDDSNKFNFTRLPKNVKPNHYFLFIRADISTFKFSGKETIQIDVLEPTNTIVLNALDIEIQLASFIDAHVQEQQSVKIELDKREEVAIITFANPLEVGAGQLKLQFTGEINDLMTGFYRNKYTTQDGEVRYGATTQFESVFCRKAFPCWDEPELKAKFDLTLVVPKDRVALSNTNIVQETVDEVDPTKRVVKFATTPKMSTYLVCYIIGEYEYLEQKTKNGTQCRLYTLIGKTEQAKFGLDIAVKCLEFYEEYFKILYPLPKLDMIAISDFQNGAMENWGLVTYRETCVLLDTFNSSTFRKQRIARTICHELAHQWFGNLVTMKWWDNLWLNEGFARFMEHLAVDHLLPELNIWENFTSDTFASALDLDALHNSHPIEVPVYKANDIEEIFDQISYEKGSSIIRMIYYYIGSEDFQKGLISYLTDFSYSNTVTEDLWASLEAASNKPVGLIMNTWTKQKGYPVISVSSRQDGANRVLTLSQEKFSIDGVLNEKDQQVKWLIPINVISQNNQKYTKFLLEEKTQELILENVEPNEWVKLNPNMTSFFIVNYSMEMFEQLKPSVLNQSLGSIDRLNLLNDLFYLVQSGKVSSDRLLRFMECLPNEENNAVWETVISCLRKFNKVLAYTDFQEVFHLYVRKLLAKTHAKLGNKPIQGENQQNAILRAIIISMLVACKDPQLLQEAKSQFDSHVSKLIQISPDLRGPIYTAVASDCDDKTFELFIQLYRENELSEEKLRYLMALGVSKDISHIQRFIDFVMSDEVRKQDKCSMFYAVSARNKIGRDIVWNYFKENLNVFKEKYDTATLRSLVECITCDFATEERLQDVSSFFANNPIQGTDRSVQQTLESIKSNVDLLSRDSLVIKNYLTNQ